MMNRLLLQIVRCVLFCALCLSIPASFKRLTCGFWISKLQLDLPSKPDWDTVPFISDKEAWGILSQSFHYLGRGAQCYAFLSEDGLYVLKLFRFDQQKNLLTRLCTFFGCEFSRISKSEFQAALGIRRLFYSHMKHRTSFEEKIVQLFHGCKLACERAVEETGLVYLHLNQTMGTLPQLHARSPLLRPISLPLDQYRFALQKKAAPLRSVLTEAHHLGCLQERLNEILVLLESRIRKGIGNADSNLWRNFGFLKDRAIEIDFGHYVSRPDLMNSPYSRRCEFRRYLHPLQTWLQKTAPEHLPEFEARVEKILENI